MAEEFDKEKENIADTLERETGASAEDIAAETDDTQTFDAAKTETNIPPESELKQRRSGETFAVRMHDAGYAVAVKYDAIKNAFLSYRSQKSGRMLKARIVRDGETYTAGRDPIAKLCLVGGYLRLFLALDPKEFNQNKYHHKDYTEVARYANYPLMIKISSDRQLKNALELIAALLEKNGYAVDPDYIPGHQAQIFDNAKPTKKIIIINNVSERETAAAADVSAREDGDGTAESSVEESAEVAESLGENAQIDNDGVPAPAEEISAVPSEGFTGTAEDSPKPKTVDKARLPVRATVVDGDGVKIGKIRDSVWYDTDDVVVGNFDKTENDNVYFHGINQYGYVDRNNNVLTLADKYIATVRYTRWGLILILVLLAALVAVSACFTAYYIATSNSVDVPPVLFIAEEGKSWEDTKNLKVFFNEKFGDAVIEPGMKGSYAFTFENRNENALIFNLAFTETNPYGIELLYRLKRDGAYVAGADGYVNVGGISCNDLTIEAASSTVFELEWFWRDNDETDTEAGENEAQYTLNIKFSANVLAQA